MLIENHWINHVNHYAINFKGTLVYSGFSSGRMNLLPFQRHSGIVPLSFLSILLPNLSVFWNIIPAFPPSSPYSTTHSLIHLCVYALTTLALEGNCPVLCVDSRLWCSMWCLLIEMLDLITTDKRACLGEEGRWVSISEFPGRRHRRAFRQM